MLVGVASVFDKNVHLCESDVFNIRTQVRVRAHARVLFVYIPKCDTHIRAYVCACECNKSKTG